jgi:hypothetical protein
MTDDWPDDHPLRPARGVWNALLYSIPIWALILLAAYLLTRMM